MIKLHHCRCAPILACTLRHRHTDATLTSHTMPGTGRNMGAVLRPPPPQSATLQEASVSTQNGNGSAHAAPAGWHELPHPKGFVQRSAIQGRDNWAGMFTNDADQPVTDKDLQMELTKTGYLIQSAYSYLKVYQDNNATIGLPMGEVPALTIATMPGDKEGASAADTIAAAAAASKYTVPDEETFILRATAGLYPGEISKVFQDKDLATNPVGYVALSEDKKDIAVVFRGTRLPQEWLSNFTVLVTSWDEVDKTVPAADGKKTEDAVWVETGFETMYRRFVSTPGDSLSLQGQMQRTVTSLLTANKEVESITVCGHSLGGALASMSAFDLAISELNKKGGKPEGSLIPVTCYTWEAPRVGNQTFADKFSKFEPNAAYLQLPRARRANKPYVNMFRVVNKADVVPKAPYERFQTADILPWRLVPYLFRTCLGAIDGKESRDKGGFHQGGTSVQVDLQIAWNNDTSGVKYPAAALTKIPSQAHALWINMWLVNHDVKIPEAELKGDNA
ncbi:g7967 [Coccomyxa viridis]|uniref:G7967 protein n=1 Tax=Coccomyxa viridis TaxID=1274662 RepID=A0ABP1FZ89_9CHLO